MPRGPKEEPFKDCFKIDKSSGCWEWQRYRTKRGYGRRCYLSKSRLAHRVSWMLNKGAIPDGLSVLHKCDNPSCVNPDHLFLGTNLDNVIDKCKKKRQSSLPGERNGMSKLTKDQIIEIRSDDRSVRELAKIYGVYFSNISAIKLRKTWGYF